VDSAGHDESSQKGDWQNPHMDYPLDGKAYFAK
jgi:hypothetical protein